MSEIDWAIEPRVGVGPIRFGMSPQEVAEILGPFERRHATADSFAPVPELAAKYRDHFEEWRMFEGGPEHPTISYDRDGVKGVEFIHPTDALRLGELRLFGAPRKTVLLALFEIDQDVWDDGEGYVFRTLGLSMANSRHFRNSPTIYVAGAGEFHDEEELEDLEYGPIVGAPK